MIINVDRKNRSINVSVKARDLAEETEAMKQLRSEQAAASAGATNLGALLRAKLDKSGSNPQHSAGPAPTGEGPPCPTPTSSPPTPSAPPPRPPRPPTPRTP